MPRRSHRRSHAVHNRLPKTGWKLTPEKRGWIRPQAMRLWWFVSLSRDAAGEAAWTRGHQMPRYLISFDAHALDHIPDEDMPAVARAAHEVVEEAMNAGVWVFGGGLEHQKASIVATEGTVTDGSYPEAIGGFCVVDVPSREEALKWAAKNAVACRCAQEVRGFMPDPAVGN